MDANMLFAEIRDHIAKAQTKQALSKLLAHLEQAPQPVRDWANTVRQIKADFYSTENSEQKSIISRENARLEYGKVNHRLLQVIESLEGGHLVPKTAAATKPPKSYVGIGIALAAVAIMLLVVFVMSDNQNPDEPEELLVVIDPTDCPVFPPDSDFNIMLLPFKPLDNKATDVDSGLRDRLAREIEKYSIPATVLTRNIDVTDSNAYPSSYSEAEAIGTPCEAKLIVWGTSEKLASGELITTTKFRFLNIEEFSQTAFFLDSSAEIDTISSLSSIAAEGALTQTLEQSLKILFGLIAHESNMPAVAANIIEEVAKDMEEPLGANWGMVLADSYTQLEDYNQAIRVYDDILANNPGHEKALENRAYLYYKRGDYSLAAHDLGEVSKEKPDNISVRTARAAALVRSNQLDAARTEIEIVEQSNENPKVTSQLRMEYQKNHNTETRRKTEAEETLRRNPRDTSALKIQADAAINLGQYDVAELAASNLLREDPKNKFAMITLNQIKPNIKDTTAFNRRILDINPGVLQNLRTIQNIQIQQ